MYHKERKIVEESRRKEKKRKKQLKSATTVRSWDTLDLNVPPLKKSLRRRKRMLPLGMIATNPPTKRKMQKWLTFVLWHLRMKNRR